MKRILGVIHSVAAADRAALPQPLVGHARWVAASDQAKSHAFPPTAMAGTHPWRQFRWRGAVRDARAERMGGVRDPQAGDQGLEPPVTGGPILRLSG